VGIDEASSPALANGLVVIDAFVMSDSECQAFVVTIGGTSVAIGANISSAA
jgi:hypothetical protein